MCGNDKVKGESSMDGRMDHRMSGKRVHYYDPIKHKAYACTWKSFDPVSRVYGVSGGGEYNNVSVSHVSAVLATQPDNILQMVALRDPILQELVCQELQRRMTVSYKHEEV